MLFLVDFGLQGRRVKSHQNKTINLFQGVWGTSLGRDVQAGFEIKGAREEED